MQHPGQPDDQRQNLGQTYPYIEAAEGTKIFLNVALEQGNDLLGVKTHLDSSFFLRQLQNPETCPRFLVVARNPKDTLVSHYHFHRSLHPHNGFDKPFEVFFEMFKQDVVQYGNSIDYAASWWKYRHHPRVHFVKYEDMLKNPMSNISEIASFLGYSLTKDEVSCIEEKASFFAMKKKGIDAIFLDTDGMTEDRSQFFRKGVKGDWRNMLTPEMSDYVDEIVKQRCPVGLNFDE